MFRILLAFIFVVELKRFLHTHKLCSPRGPLENNLISLSKRKLQVTTG